MATSGSDLRIVVTDLRRHPGDRMRVERDVDLADVSVSTAAVPPGSPGHLDVVVESLTDGVTVTGSLGVPWRGPCRRCLEDTEGVAHVALREVYVDAPVGEDLLPLDGDAVDLAPMVHDAAVLALPIAPLCREDCPGPAPDAFPVHTGVESEHPVDPRWSALDELRFAPEPDDRLG